VLVLLTEAGAPTAALLAAGLLGGFALPAVGAALRALWKGLLGSRVDLLPTAFALDAVCIEALFTLGPLAAAVIVAVVSPAAAVLLCGACSLLGTIAFVAQAPSRHWLPDAAAGSHGLLGALLAPSLAAMAFLILPAGLLIAPLGAVGNQLVGEVAPRGAATEAFTWPTTAIIAGFAAGTAVGGTLVDAVDWRAGFIAAVLAAALGALVAFARRASLQPGLQPA
jgi:MFS family permease